MNCDTCSSTLASDGGCARCWIQRVKEQDKEIGEAEAEFFKELRRRYRAWADIVFDLTGIYPTFKEYDDLWGEELHRGS